MDPPRSGVVRGDSAKSERTALRIEHRSGFGDVQGMGQAGLVDHEGREGAVNDLQHRGKPLRLGGKQMQAGLWR